jgi:hypothetical protein
MHAAGIREIAFPFIACATGLALFVAMRAADRRAAQGA